MCRPPKKRTGPVATNNRTPKSLTHAQTKAIPPNSINLDSWQDVDAPDLDSHPILDAHWPFAPMRRKLGMEISIFPVVQYRESGFSDPTYRTPNFHKIRAQTSAGFEGEINQPNGNRLWGLP